MNKKTRYEAEKTRIIEMLFDPPRAQTPLRLWEVGRILLSLWACGVMLQTVNMLCEKFLDTDGWGG